MADMHCPLLESQVVATDLKDKGNAALKRGPKYYSDAIDLYTKVGLMLV